MKKSLALFAALFVLGAGWPAVRPVGSQDKGKEPERRGVIVGDPATKASVMKELRDKLLTSGAEEVGLSGADAEARVWGVLMDVTFTNGTATLVSLRDGTSSLYTTGGGGVLGGLVAKTEARAFVIEAGKHLTHMRPAKEFPYPREGRVKFYALTRDGVFTVEAGMDEVVERGHRLMPLYYAADQVLTQLRLASEKTGP